MATRVGIISDTHGLLRPEVLDAIIGGNAKRFLGMED